MLMDSLNLIPGVEGHMELFLDQYRQSPPIAGCNDYLRFIEQRLDLSPLRPRATWQYLSILYQRKRTIGFKLMYTHLKKYPEIVPYSLAKRLKIIHLVRSNYLDVVISEKLARLTSVSHTKDQEWNTGQGIYLEPRDALQSIKKRARQVNMMTFVCKVIWHDRLTVYYEDLLRDYGGSMRQICSFLGVGEVGVFKGSELKKRQTKKKCDIIQNYADIKATLSRDGFDYLVDS